MYGTRSAPWPQTPEGGGGGGRGEGKEEPGPPTTQYFQVSAPRTFAPLPWGRSLIPPMLRHRLAIHTTLWGGLFLVFLRRLCFYIATHQLTYTVAPLSPTALAFASVATQNCPRAQNGLQRPKTPKDAGPDIFESMEVRRGGREEGAEEDGVDGAEEGERRKPTTAGVPEAVGTRTVV